MDPKEKTKKTIKIAVDLIQTLHPDKNKTNK